MSFPYFVSSQVINEIIKTLALGVPTPLLSIDITNTVGNGSVVPDYTWGGQFLFVAEDLDPVTKDTQIRFGITQVAVAYNTATLAWSTIAQLLIGGTSVATAGNLTMAFAWGTSGTVATLSVTPTVTVIAPPSVRINYFVLYSSHPNAITYL